MKRLFRDLACCGVVFFLCWSIKAEAKNNSHNDYECTFCHKVMPRFGADNRETVTFTDGAWDDPALCLRCHRPEENIHPIGIKPGAIGTTVPTDLPLGDSSDRLGAVVCVSCHFIHAANADFALLRGFPGSQSPNLFKKWQDLCRQCHGTALGKRSPHEGDDRSCVFCHQAVPRKGTAASLSDHGEALCNFCHGGLQNEHFNKADPFNKGSDCRLCHDPHLGADRPGRLTAEYLAAAATEVTIDPHYRKTLCFTCHREEKGYPLTVKDDVALCNRCHGSGRIVGDLHPLAHVGAEVNVPKDWPLKDGSLTCLTCHRAGHRDDKPFYRFLRGGPFKDRNDICFNCHNRDAFKKRNPHLDINQNRGCEFCHASRPVPGKDNFRTVKLVAEINLLCLRCHDYAPHPAGFQHTMVLDGDRAKTMPDGLLLDKDNRIICATCHNPHIEETGGYKLRDVFGGMTVCAGCHRY